MQSPPVTVATARRPGAAAVVLQASALAGQRGDRALFSGLEMALAPGSVTWLRGRNGRGKTSLLRLLAGLSTPMAGEIRVAGRTLREGGPTWRRHWVYIGHQNALKDDLSATEALRFLARLHGLPADDTLIAGALRRMGVANRQHAPVRTLSQGQRRRVALARLVLSQSAPVWLLDEPFDALDTDGIAALNDVIAGHAATGGCVLLTSHQPLTLTSPVPAVFDLEPYAASA
ncbi:MAG: cytochrome c biogenesis heme-transporting ATPase CcmA [Rubrivivax sp.]|nr:cytochrome c biogenesis heme-transporting ATPase CcmA [Rubrivivax sp.]